ncbi:unnamed protein product [Kluyveromyces dobzhanskii CBS 2104]|uniref:WGS project CCBQ000000000 data, contig 00058 n=1 Tax=Kluyveromyces dobzhanskii CBS 2104 TaxID=1427455 RepID=A0A0A8LBZ8_9SACH|nr:unnamed protein product [Kluyveromyces dobzhanskii CBS 2104]
MPETQRSRSPLLRSLSSKDLRGKTQARPPFAKQLSNEHQNFPSETALFHDLDSLLSKKLHLSDSNDSQHETNGSSDRLFVDGQNNGDNIGSPDDASGEEDEDDSEFANVDEIDGPISPSSSTGILKDYFQGQESHNNGQSSPKQLKKIPDDSNDVEKIIPNEDISAEEDNNLPVDDALKKLLQEKAEEIERGDTSHSFTKPSLDWVASDFYSLFHELPEWFIQKDYNCLKTAKVCFEKSYDCTKFVEEHQYALQVITELGRKLELNSMDMKTLLCLSYIAFGTFQETSSYFHHLDILRRNNTLLMTISKAILPCFIKHADCCRVKNSNLQQYNTLLFYSSTIIYFMTNIAIDQRNMHKKSINEFITDVQSFDIMIFLTKYVDQWRWRSRLSMRIRNIIILFHKVLLLQFGAEDHYNEVKKFVHEVHDITKKEFSASNLSVSPLEYAAFREDIISRFPSSELPQPTYPSILDNPNSLSQFLEIPRPRSRSTSNQSLAEPQVHIATPAPSPPSSPTNSNGPKSRKSFQANLSYPAFFPTSGDFDTGVVDELSNKLNIAVQETVLPYNTQEAIEILSKSVHIKLSTKQLWHERKLFMIQERGWKNTKNTEKDPFTYSSMKCEEAETMDRVESYYADALPYLSSLIYVLLETIETCASNKFYFEQNYTQEETNELQPQLELIRSKEISMKSSTAILFLLLKWFKLSHFLKFEYLCSLIYDSKFISTSVCILHSFTEEYQNKIYGKYLQPTHSFWRECSLFNVQYENTLAVSIANETATQLNLKMLNSEVYLLRILSKVTGKKTQRLKDLPLNVSNIFKSLYSVYNLKVYHPMLKIIHELAPFKNKRWRADHMELISGVFLHERLNLTDNWITGKDITGEINDAYGQEIALRAMLQFYNFYHYKRTMEHCGYNDKSSNSFFSREAELLSAPY